MNNTPPNETANLLDYIKDEDIVSYLEESKNNPSLAPIDIDMNEIQRKRKEIIRQKLKNKMNNFKNNRSGKESIERMQLEALKNNESFRNIQGNNEEMKKAIESMASNMTKDPKQKKNIKKQMDKLIEKMSETKL